MDKDNKDLSNFTPTDITEQITGIMEQVAWQNAQLAKFVKVLGGVDVDQVECREHNSVLSSLGCIEDGLSYSSVCIHAIAEILDRKFFR